MIVSTNPDVVACDLEDGLAILNPHKGTYYSLNDVGRFVWLLMTTPVTPESLCGAIVENYDCDAHIATADIATLIAELQAADLIRISGHGSV